jgi:hypothetical protein
MASKQGGGRPHPARGGGGRDTCMARRRGEDSVILRDNYEVGISAAR